ncbi:MAG: carboxypeptidase-like regulatory domain-containing protein, partial [Bryobacteraceae bacterium]
MPRAAPRVILYLMIAFHAALILLSAIPGRACTCLKEPPMAPCQAMAKVQIAFTGRVLAVDRTGNDLRARIRIDEAFRGISGTEVDVYTSNSSCGILFEAGKSFFIEARRGATGRLFTGGCGSYATSLHYAKPYIDALRALANPDSPVQIFGFATADPASIRMQYGNAIPTPGIRIHLDDGNQRWETTTNEKGAYAFTGIPPGKFRLTAEIPGVPEPHNQRTFQLSPGHCSSENFLT